MAANGAHGTRRHGGGADLDWDHPEHGPEPRYKRDWKRLLLVIGLGALSWVATFVGMLELIEANVGELPSMHKVIIGFSVAMLMVMVVWLLDQIFSDIGWTARLLFVAGYVFLTIISVGFGFGFYWKVLESRGEASRSAESAVGQVQNALHAGVTRLEQLQGTLDRLTVLSAEKAALERQSGTSCPNSRPGDGPRRQLRDDDAGRFKLAADFVRGRVAAIRSELGALNGDLAKVMSNDRSTFDGTSGTRNDYMRGLNRRLDLTVTGFNAFRSDPQLKQIRSDLGDRSDRVSFADTRGGSFHCPDAQLSTALKGVVRAIDELPSLEKPRIAAVEGSEAVIEAFRRLSASLIGALTFKMPPSAEELRELQKKAVQSVEGPGPSQARLQAMASEAGLSRRDYIPLAIALFVDLCLLLVSIKRPASGLDALVPKMRAAERGPVIQILSRFNEIHRDREVRESFEVFRHVVFDFHGDYYAAIPLNTPYRPGQRNGRPVQGNGIAEADVLLEETLLLTNLFASFEKERIFTRVISPLLTTASVQKRLRRQGSKFADAGAFRIYRFRDGAWSDIILGAVMGAARRVEATQRRRRIEEDLFRQTGPELDLPPYHSPRSHHPGPGFDGAPGATGGEGRLGRGPRRTSFNPRVVVRNSDDAGNRHSGSGSGASFARSAEASHDVASDAGAAPAAATVPPIAENVVLHPAVSRSGQPPAEQADAPSGGVGHDPSAALPTEPQASSQRSVTRNIPPDLRFPVAATRGSAGEPTVTIAATRESVTYTLPVSEARLPPSLLARAVEPPLQPLESALPRSLELPEAPPLASPGEPATASASPPPLPTTDPQISVPPPPYAGVSGMATDELRSLALRFGPAKREG